MRIKERTNDLCDCLLDHSIQHDRYTGSHTGDFNPISSRPCWAYNRVHNYFTPRGRDVKSVTRGVRSEIKETIPLTVVNSRVNIATW